MSSEIKVNPSFSASSSQQAVSKNETLSELSDRVGRCMAESMQEIVAHSEKAYSGWKADRNLLNTGIWYPIDYALALKESGNNKRYEWMRDHEHLASGFAPKDQFASVIVDDRRRHWGFIAKQGILPSDAVKAAKQGLAILDCGAVCQLARYDALCKILGEEKFNQLFGSSFGDRVNLNYEYDDNLQPMKYFVDFSAQAKKQILGSLGKRPVKVGQLVLFHGVPQYKQKHGPSGMGGHFNAIVLENSGQQRYIAHGFPARGLTEEEVATRMIEEYNRDLQYELRTPTIRKVAEAFVIAQASCAKYADHKLPLDNPLEHVIGYDRGSPQEFRIKLIADLVRLPLEQVKMDYVRSWAKI